MFTKQNLLATLAGAVVCNLLGWGIWGLAMVDFFEGHTINQLMKDPVDMLWLVIANIVQVFAIATIFGKWANGSYGASEGFKFGIWVGIFMLGTSLLWYATSEFMDLTGHLVDGVASIVFWGVIGAIIGIVYKATE